MGGFKGSMASDWLFRQEARLFGNFMRNWQDEVRDPDFFVIFGDDGGEESELAMAMLSKHYTLEELEDCDVIRGSPRGEAEGGKTTLRMGAMAAVTAVWNRFGKAGRGRCRAMLEEWLAEVVKRHGGNRRRRRKDPLEERMDEVCKVLSLGEVERDLIVYALVRQMTAFDDFPWDGRRPSGHGLQVTALAMAIDRPCGTVEKAISAGGKLRKYEVLDSDGDLDRGPVREFLEEGGGKMLEGQFYGKADMGEVLPWAYFGPLARQHGELLKQLVASADGKKGVHILLYGAPGTGKTSFAKALAREAGKELYEIRQGDRDGGKMSAQSRMSGLRICCERVPPERSMALVDEADELLRTNRGIFAFFGLPAGGDGTEKGVINSLLDETRLPTVWISNSPAEALDESVRRRFDYSVKFARLGERQRRAIWANSIEKLRLGKLVTPEMADGFARKYPASAGGIAMVLGNVRRMRPRKGEVAGLVERLMKPHCELTGMRGDDEKMVPARDYSLAGLNIRGEVSLGRVVEAVRRFQETVEGAETGDPDRPRMNLLLWGPPGTGKTEFVKHLGAALDAQVVARSGSDLLSMWVGGTEKNIRAAFEEAEAERSILFLDEIDGLLQNRAGAVRSWEVTQVNELLQRMETFRGVMIAATNFMDNLDPAVLRRFTFKLQFDYLTNEGKRLFFERMFRTRLDAAEAARLSRIPCLAPGDYRTARQSLHYLGGEVTNAMRLDALERESALKKDGGKGRIGF